jgi:protein SCO1
MRKNRIIFVLIVSIALLSYEARASQNINGNREWLIEKTGHYLPLDIPVRDENGKKVQLKELIDKPTLFVLVYYSCHHICPQVLGGISDAVSKLPLVPGKEYEVITMSFDSHDIPAQALALKRNFIMAAGKDFPADAWKFLTGDEESIHRVAEAIGFKFRKEGHGFVHPSVLTVLSPEGMIAGYINVEKYLYGVAYPVTFSPEELAQAFSAASTGKIITRGRAPLLFCFPHEPEKWGGFYRLLGITGISTLALMGFLLLYLTVTSHTRE